MATTKLDFILDTLQDISSVSFGSFMVVHLTAPISAFISAGEPTASSIQLLGRVWYQDSKTREILIVWGSLGVHIIVGIVKRITRVGRLRQLRGDLERSAKESEQVTEGTLSPSERRTLSKRSLYLRLREYMPRTWHALTAYITLPLLADHILSHRLRPATPVSYLFVSYHLQMKPILSSLKYSLLVSFATFHTLVGFNQLWSKYRPGHSKKRRSIQASERSWTTGLGWLGVVSAVGLGVRSVSREPVPSWLARRYAAILG
ncbi:uncharacterized protein MELLADRAFT_73884 [Melampsora larici-populina 98AG31]|uniref:Mitochondrial adapter protein MCP1 transmembrane domain-containing protein n=1 Tax=Melampsora larici-populina (strain 98AG31 / pathotype 3-4-7) TaxID=747676 RepID=F4R4R4_MELLP|nr:uncharacterized protein MELLADRAFT_73884 [Melampsora larici-populina 98AG31]EGG12854.1 hypothetical protein MELLADRAFT_73884 [Melampsora larici-populina 98AG31]